jgi:hypothetical protein
VQRIQLILSCLAICALLIMPTTLDARDQVISIPAGTVINVRMIDSINSDQNQVGQTFRGSLNNSIRVGNRVILPRGANAYVKLVGISSAGRVKGRSELELQLNRIVVGNRVYRTSSNIVAFRGRSESKKTAKSAGVGAAVGGGVGALLGGGKGAAIGAGLGAGTGVAAEARTRGPAVWIPSESLVSFRLATPLHWQG